MHHYAYTYLPRKLFAREGKRINVAAQLLQPAFCRERVRCFRNNSIASRLFAVTNIERDFNFFK